MINTDVVHINAQTALTKKKKQQLFERNTFHLRSVAVFILLFTCLGMSWFAYQCFLVPQTIDFAPDWQGANWIQSADGTASVAYFRYAASVVAAPDAAFVTIAASQVFRLSVNGSDVGTNSHDFEQGHFPQTYMYNIATLVKPGPNVFAVVVSNFNTQTPALRMSVGLVQGKTIHSIGTGTGDASWKATILSDMVYPHSSTGMSAWNRWTANGFDASSWQLAERVNNVPASSVLTVNPLLYEQPLSSYWMSAGLHQEAYFVRSFSLPSDITSAWLRIVVVGSASVFINGHSSIVWDGQPVQNFQDTMRYLSDNTLPVQYHAGLEVGVYNITPFIHKGKNTIAVHVKAPLPTGGTSQTGLASLNAAMSLDMLVTDLQGKQVWISPDVDWRASTMPVDGWVQVNQATNTWSSPIMVGRPGQVGTIFVQTSNTSRNVLIVPVARAGFIIMLCTGAVFGLWLLMSLVVMRRYYSSYTKALETMSLAFVPVLVSELLLIVLAHAPNIPQPFPYTWHWMLILILFVGVGYALLWLNAHTIQKNMLRSGETGSAGNAGGLLFTAMRTKSLTRNVGTPSQKHILSVYLSSLLAWMRVHWPLILILVIAAPLIFYNLPYEPYWQDELVSYYAAKGILAHGIPVMPSGFIYPKGELYSYMLALCMAIFGDGNGAPRLLSVIEYFCSLPLLYWVGTYFFGRRVALLATATLAFSPMALLWGRQVRMYEQAQLLTLLATYTLYKALQAQRRVYHIYIAIACLVLMYLSHEETFIVFPAITLWVLFASKDEKRRSFAVLFQKHWWIAGALGAAIISVQLLIVHFTHPAVLGTDQSQTPFIQFTTNNIPYYIKLLFAPWALGKVVAVPWITLNSLLATIGCIMAFRGQHEGAKYCAWFVLSSFLTLMLVFTLASDRYLYPILPIYYLIGAYAAIRLLTIAWRFARPCLVGPYKIKGESDRYTGDVTTTPRPINIAVHFIVTCYIASIIILPILPANDYNPFVSQVLGLSNHRHYPDYDGMGQYMKQHWQKGDIVIAIVPAISVLHYVGHIDYFFSIDHALYLFEQNGQITDTPTGSRPLLNQADFQAVLARNARIWIISDNASYQSQVQKLFTFPPDFHLVYQGYQSAIYLRGD